MSTIVFLWCILWPVNSDIVTQVKPLQTTIQLDLCAITDSLYMHTSLVLCISDAALLTDSMRIINTSIELRN